MTGPAERDFFDPRRHGFVRVAAAVPRLRVADPAYNGAETVVALEAAVAEGAVVVAFPELGLSAYSCDDLFHQRALLDGCEAALAQVAEATARLPALVVVGLPVRAEHRLFNAAAVVCGGRVLGVVPKTYLPNYGEFYEARQFAPATAALGDEIEIAGARVPFGADLVFRARNEPLLALHAEICEDVWVPVPPSSFAALAGATVLVNLSASNITIGKADYRHKLVAMQSARCLAAYVYTSAGGGESTTDLAWDGQALVYENGELLAEGERFADAPRRVVADVDLDRLSRERIRQTSFADSARRHRDEVGRLRSVGFELPAASASPGALRRRVARFPYVPSDAVGRDARCAEVYSIQVTALAKRLAAAHIETVVVGVSGGLDSTHALLVCAATMDRLRLPRTNVVGCTMPGFATSERTLEQARRLMRAVGCTAREIDIRPSCEQMLKDIGHPSARGERVFDIAFENVQAGERTSHLFRIANQEGGLVAGTGDLSELALGWSTYGVGDHMSHYNVNASVPKTLVSHLVRWVAQRGGIADAGVLEAILATEISPELVPSDGPAVQRSEAAVGPYDLQDFHLYQVLRFGFLPSKVAFLAWTAWHDEAQGDWPDGVPRRAYSIGEIRDHLANFLKRFFETSQFKRSCVPNAPKVGSGGSLSPRGDWRAPSDSVATAWLDELAAHVPEHRA